MRFVGEIYLKCNIISSEFGKYYFSFKIKLFYRVYFLRNDRLFYFVWVLFVCLKLVLKIFLKVEFV